MARMTATVWTLREEEPEDATPASTHLVARLIPAGARVLATDRRDSLARALGDRACSVAGEADRAGEFDVVVLSARAGTTLDDVLAASAPLVAGGLLVAAATAGGEPPPSREELCALLDAAGLAVQDVRTETRSGEEALVVSARTEELGPVTAQRLAVLRRERDDARDELRATRRTLEDLDAAQATLQAHAAAAGEREQRLRAAALQAAQALLERDRRLLALEHEHSVVVAARAGLAQELDGATRELASQLAVAAVKERHLAAQEDLLCAQQAELVAGQARHAEQERRLAEQHAQAAEQHAHIATQHVQIAEQCAQIDAQHAHIATQHARIDELHAELAQRHAQIVEQRAQIAEDRARIAELEDRLTRARQRLAEGDDALRDVTRQIDELRATRAWRLVCRWWRLRDRVARR